MMRTGHRRRDRRGVWGGALLLACVVGCSEAPKPAPVEREAPEDSLWDAPKPVDRPPIRAPKFDVAPPTPPPKPRVALPLEGTVFAHGGGPITPALINRFAKLCGPAGPLVVIPTASEAADKPSYLDKLPKRWKKRVEHVTVLHTLDRSRANEASFIAPLREAKCVWFGGGAQGRLRDAYVDTPLHDALHELLLRGGVIGGYSAGAAILSGTIIRRGATDPVEDEGFDVLPGAIIDQHFIAHEREPRLRTMLQRHPDLIGYGIDEDTALIVSGSSYEVVGNSVVRRCTHDGGCTSLPAGSRGTFP